jgi:hypothetical protein
VIRLQSREAPGFEQVKEQFRIRLINQRFIQAESAFVAGVEDQGRPIIEEGAEALMREATKDPAAKLSRRAARKALVTYAGGAVTVGDYRAVLQAQQPEFRAQVEGATDEQIQNFLKGMAQRELLIAEAGRRGLAPSQARVDSLVAEARLQLRAVVADIGLLRVERAPGEALEPAVARAVRKALTDVLTGAKDVVPLGPLSFQLRERTEASVFETGLGQVVINVGQIRARRGLSATDSASWADTARSSPEPE